MKAMLLAAGRGSRMGALTDKTPKPLLAVAGKPLLEHHIERLKQAGFTGLVVNTSYLGSQIEDFVGDGSRWGIPITCTYEPERLETGGGILNALPWLLDEANTNNDGFAIVNGDVWTDYSLRSLRQVNLGDDCDAHLVMVPNPTHNAGGDFYLQSETGQVRNQAFTPVPAPASTPASLWQALTYSGLAVLSARLFAESQPGAFPLAPLLRDAMTKQRVSGELHSGLWVDVGTPERLADLSARLQREV